MEQFYDFHWIINPYGDMGSEKERKTAQEILRFHTYVVSSKGMQALYIVYESETYKSQMYGHNAGQPVSSLYTKYYIPYLG